MQIRRSIPFVIRTVTTLTYNSKSHANLSLISDNKTLNKLIQSGSLYAAIKLFDEMPNRDVITWNILISGHNNSGFPQKSLYLYSQMVSQGIKENCSTFSSIVSVCSSTGFYKQGLQVHCRVIVLGFNTNIFIGSALADLYMKLDSFNIALKLVSNLQERNLATWNIIFRGFSDMARSIIEKSFTRSSDILRLFYNMRLEDIKPNGVSFCYLIQGCGNARFLNEGKQLHCCVIKHGWSESNIFVSNALVDFYSSFESVIDVIRSFEVIPFKDVISWNSMVFAYASNNLLFNAIEVFNIMLYWGKKPSSRSLLGLLNMSSRVKDVYLGKQIHSHVLKLGFDIESVLIQSALINMYGKCNDIESSVCIFETVPERTLECCNSLMSSLLHCSAIDDVIELFGLMVDESIGFDEVSLSSTLKAMSISRSSSLHSCKLLHSCVIKSGFESNIAVSCSLIDAYSKSGEIKHSCQVFDNIHLPNVICFTSIINAYARNGMGIKSLEMFDLMIEKGINPDKVTFLCVLMGCNHSGLVQEGRLIYDLMRTKYEIYPERQHVSCMVDLLGRAGLLDEAEMLLDDPTAKDDSIALGSLLRSCRFHRNEKIGKRVAKKLIALEPNDHAVWLQISSFYSEIGDFEMSEHIQELGIARKLRKDIGYSLVEVYNV